MEINKKSNEKNDIKVIEFNRKNKVKINKEIVKNISDKI